MRQPDPDHFLINSRVAAVVGLIGLGGGIGLSLMTARVLPYVGFVVAILCSAAVLWIYAKYLRRAYRSITKRIPYKGPQAKELLIASFSAVFLMILSLWVLSIVLISAPPAGRAILEAGLPELVKIPASSKVGFINVSVRNAGTLDADNARILMSEHISVADLPIDALKTEMDNLTVALSKFDATKAKLGLHRQIRAGSAAVITLESISGDQWSKLTEGQSPRSDTSLIVTDEQWAAYQRGEMAIYILYVANYEDSGHAGTSYWHSHSCAFVRGAVNFSHNCSDNRIELTSRPR